MTTIKWVNGDTAAFETASAWSGGVVPVAGDTAVISSAGDTAPTDDKVTGILTPGKGSSHPYLCGLSLSTDTLEYDHEANGDVIEYYVTPQESAVHSGETINPSVLDLIGAGSEAALTLQNSTVAAKTVTNVSGDGYVYAGYTNTWNGNINIGLPFSVNGTLVTPTGTDVHGFENALYVDVQAYGSWSGANTPNGYVPGLTSAGTIKVAADSALWVSVAGSPARTSTKGTITTETPTTTSAFTNDGKIDVSAGGSLHVSASGGLGELLNDGSITMAGAAGDTTIAQVQAAVEGSGTWILSGGSQTNPGYTGAVFGNYVLGQTFDVSNATLFVDGGTGVSENNMAFLSGNVDFTGANGVLLISAGIDQPVTSIFDDTLTGFDKGDQIQLSYGQLPLDGGTWKPELSWDASTKTLDLYNVRSDGTNLEASFVLNGSYVASDFSLANVSWNGEAGTQTDVTILSSLARAGAANLVPGDWGGLSAVGLAGGEAVEAGGRGFGALGELAAREGVVGLGHSDWLTGLHGAGGFLPHG